MSDVNNNATTATTEHKAGILAPIGRLKYFLYKVILVIISSLILEFYPEKLWIWFVLGQFIIFPILIYKRGRDINGKPFSFLFIYTTCVFFMFYSMVIDETEMGEISAFFLMILGLALQFRKNENNKKSDAKRAE